MKVPDNQKRPPLLEGENVWGFYESSHEIDKYVSRIKNFLIPLLKRTCASKVLEVGCGSGYGTVYLKQSGYDAWGIDPNFRNDVSSIWPFLKKGSGLDLPFEDASFDLCFSLEVIEHIGTIDGEMNVAPNVVEQRTRFVGEICRVANRWVVLTTPNRYFFVDEHKSDSKGRFGFRIHSPFEKFTLSAKDLEKMFHAHGFVLDSYPDPRGYYELERVNRRFGHIGIWLAQALLALSTSKIFARTFLNPHLFMLFRRIEIR